MILGRSNQNRFKQVPKVVEEEKQEDDGYQSNMRRARFKMIQDKNEFNETYKKRNRSTDFIKERAYPQVNHHFGDVSENEEEEVSDSSFEKEKTLNKH